MRELFIIRATATLLDAPAQWCIEASSLTNTQGLREVQSGRLSEALDAAGQLPVALILPGEECLLCTIDLPIRNKAKLLKALPYALEERLAEDPDHLHFAVGPRDAAGALSVAVIGRERLQAWLGLLAQRNVNASIVVPDMLCLPTPITRGMSVLLDSAQHCVVRSTANAGYAGELELLLEGLSLQPDADIDVYCAGGTALPEALEPHPRREVASALEVLRKGAANPYINLLQGAFAPRNEFNQRFAPLRLTAMLAAACIVLAVGGTLVRHTALRHQLNALAQQQQTLMQQEFPQIHRVVNARAQAEQALRSMRASGGGGTLYILSKALTGALQQVPGLQLQSLLLRDGRMNLELTGSNLQTLDGLRAYFASQSGITLDVQSANASGGKVSIRASLGQRA